MSSLRRPRENPYYGKRANMTPLRYKGEIRAWFEELSREARSSSDPRKRFEYAVDQLCDLMGPGFSEQTRLNAIEIYLNQLLGKPAVRVESDGDAPPSVTLAEVNIEQHQPVKVIRGVSMNEL